MSCQGRSIEPTGSSYRRCRHCKRRISATRTIRARYCSTNCRVAWHERRLYKTSTLTNTNMKRIWRRNAILHPRCTSIPIPLGKAIRQKLALARRKYAYDGESEEELFERVVGNLAHKEFRLPRGSKRSGIETLARRGVIARLAQDTSREDAEQALLRRLSGLGVPDRHGPRDETHHTDARLAPGRCEL